MRGAEGRQRMSRFWPSVGQTATPHACSVRGAHKHIDPGSKDVPLVLLCCGTGIVANAARDAMLAVAASGGGGGTGRRALAVAVPTTYPMLGLGCVAMVPACLGNTSSAAATTAAL
jgi:hypothetical protein